MTKHPTHDEHELIEKLANNPKIQKAIKGLLKPLKQEGDSIEIKIEGVL
jgi:hypothetical protein